MHLHIVWVRITYNTLELGTVSRDFFKFRWILVQEEGNIRGLILFRDGEGSCQYWTVYNCIVIFRVIWVDNLWIIQQIYFRILLYRWDIHLIQSMMLISCWFLIRGMLRKMVPPPSGLWSRKNIMMGLLLPQRINGRSH